jgi:hypothetical protein
MKLEEAVARSPVSAAERDDAMTGHWVFKNGKAFYLYSREDGLYKEVAHEELAMHDDWRPLRIKDLAPADRPKRRH